MAQKIKLGYEIGTGNEITIPVSHLIVTGLSQKSGKTTTLESLITRSKKRAVVFRTKIGEKSFLSGTIIPPYFKDQSDWQFVESLINAVMNEKIHRDERASIIKLAKQTNGSSLLDFKKKVDQRLAEKIGKWEENTLTNLQAYLELVLPKLQSITFSNTLELTDGLNIIDLERFSRDDEVQSLIIRSVLEEILYNFKDVIVVIPEAWKFIPQGKGNPCKSMVEEFIRQGATRNNFIWIDSQDIAGVDKIPLKQISEWILGYQSEINEVKHTIDQLPLPKIKKPTPDAIMSLGQGRFFYASRDLTTEVYVQPFWLDDEKSIDIAKGKLRVEDIDVPQNIAPFRIALKKTDSQEQIIDFKETSKRFSKDLSDMRTDFFNKIGDIQVQINKINVDIFKLIDKQIEINYDDLVSIVLQKLPLQQTTIPLNEDALVKKILSMVPKSVGNVVYEITPLEKIKKDFLESAKTKIISDTSNVSDNAKQLLRYLESRGIGVTVSELCVKCFLMKSGGGSYSQKVIEYCKELMEINMCDKQTNGNYRGLLKPRLTELLQVHNATEQEIENVYQHIIMEILSDKK